MTSRLRLVGSVIAALFLATTGAVAEPRRPQAGGARAVEVRVTFTAGRDVYIDRGSDAGIAIGDAIRFHVEGGASEGEVISVARASARVRVFPEFPMPERGARGRVGAGPAAEPKPAPKPEPRPEPEPRPMAKPEPAPKPAPVQRPAPKPSATDAASQGAQPSDPAREAAAAQRPPASGGTTPAVGGESSSDVTPSAIPEHPPWEGQIGDRSADQPLLAPAFGMGPAERPWRLRGRAFVSFQNYVDRAGRDDATTRSLRAGVDARVENPFGKGGRLHVDLEGDHRAVDVDRGDDRSVLRGRVDRLSYLWGYEEGAPVRVQVGRFLSSDVPEFGVLDGAEVALGLGRGALGVHAGALPRPRIATDTGDDHGVAVFYRRTAGEHGQHRALIGYQHTWHFGTNDRDLLLGQLSLVPTPELAIRSTAWVDFYTGGDRVKSRSVELTQLIVNGSYRFSREHRAGVTLSHWRYPELRRGEFDRLPARLLRRGRNSRLRLWSRHRLHPNWELHGRVGVWRDQDDDGIGGELGVRTPDLLLDGNELYLTVFRHESSFASGPGARAGVRQVGSFYVAALGYELRRETLEHLDVGDDGLDTERVFASLDFSIGRSWDLSSRLDYALGDDQDALGIQLFLQYRF